MSQKLAFIIATWFGSGLSPKAPGTVGSLATLPLVFLLIWFSGVYGIVITAVICFIIGTISTDTITQNQEEKDPGKVVIDEVVGQLLAFTFVADTIQDNPRLWGLYLIGFALFRFFDICKMGPVKWCDSHIKNAYGVMLDDVFAGLFAGASLWMIAKYMTQI